MGRMREKELPRLSAGEIRSINAVLNDGLQFLCGLVSINKSNYTVPAAAGLFPFQIYKYDWPVTDSPLKVFRDLLLLSPGDFKRKFV